MSRKAGNGADGDSAAEESLLGALLLDSSAWSKVAGTVSVDDLHRPDHRLIYTAIAELVGAGMAADVITVSDQLGRRNQLTDAGGLAYLGTLAKDTPTAANIATYAAIVRDHARRRHLHAVSTDALEHLRSGAGTDEVYARMRGGLERIEAERPAASVNLEWFANLHETPMPPQLVKGLLLAGSLFVFYGESNTGKTFLLLDLALSVAAGLPWRGRRTRKGLVLYVAGEGAASVRARIAAYRAMHPEVSGGLPFAIVPLPLRLLDSTSVDAFIELVRAAEAESGERVVLVIIDTFARSMSGGDENSTEDVGKAVAAADRIRIETGAAVGFIHHTGKDTTRGARGSTALPAACDTEILVEGQQDQRTATVVKQRDMGKGQVMTFELDSVQIGIDSDDGSPVTSCTVRHEQAGHAQPERARAKGANQVKALTALREWTRTHPEAPMIHTDELHSLLKGQGMDRHRRYEAVDFLTRIKILGSTLGGFTIDRAQL